MKDWVDAQLSRVTMYRLVTLCLSILLIVAALLSVSGYFAFSAVQLIAGAAILVAATYGSGRLFGWLFGVRPHGESSIITGLILTCLFLPPTDAIAGISPALVGVFATASKYLLAVRGRHIFNPAAVAAVVASAIGLAGAGWWVATPALLPMTLIITLLILYKTKRMQMGMLFILIATLLVTIQSVVFGNSIVMGLWFALASWPIVFFAGVMLSEPLTQPPRRLQQLIIAGLVAVLFIVPLRTPIISMTPALALLIGNGVSWWWGSRRSLRLKYIERKQITSSAYEFIFDGSVPFIAGQYIELTLPHKSADSRGVRRTFTIATSPGDTSVRFGIKIPEKSSTFKQALMQLEPGTVVQATRVAGDFVLPGNADEPVLFVAGGIGITPLISYMRSYKNRDIVLLYAVTSPSEIAYRDVLAVSGIKVIVVVPGGKADVPGGWKVIDAPYVSADILSQIKDLEQRSVYVSGPPLMVNAVTRAARRLGARKIKTDHFSGY